ncbi:response regulator [Fulvivirga ulvae]|uniref:response regulator n=1 Tax=Fulvivirga ulvae TaxID=2904245 RepID=UPI001F245E26|nr:response regulator [Fulvivirga ulvae]UII33177.1 response regulator [Fulvivirga ulvae]
MIDKIYDVDVLLVEDNPDDVELVIRALKKHNLGNNLIHLPDGAEALDFIFARGKYESRKIEQKPKVILLDLKMPKVDGLQVLKAIREDERTRLIPVVIMTSSAEQKDIIESYGLGVNAYVVKPLDFESFSKAVAELGLFWLLVNNSPG